MSYGWAVNMAINTMHTYVTVFGSDKYLHKMTRIIVNPNVADNGKFLTETTTAVLANPAHLMDDDALNGNMEGGTAITVGATTYVMNHPDSGSTLEVGKAGVTALLTMDNGNLEVNWAIWNQLV